jgi:hypothetical protein
VVRLRHAHRDLRSADPTHHAVAAIAHRWGFTNLSRLAARRTLITKQLITKQETPNANRYPNNAN